MQLPRPTTRLPDTGINPVMAAACLLPARALTLFLASLISVLLWLPQHAMAAYDISQPPAQLTWSGGSVAATANVTVTRFEDIRFYRATTGGTPITVYASHFADVDSVSGTTPVITSALPVPTDAGGNTIALDQPVSLLASNAFQSGEALFVVVEQPLLNASAFGTRPDGRRFLAVTLVVSNSSGSTSYIVALVEATPGSNRYAGYLPADSSISIPSGSQVTVQYDDAFDIADSATTAAPYSVSAATLTSLQTERRAVVGAAAAPPVTSLFLSKEALRSQVSQGELAPYRLRLSNNGTVTETGIAITDVLPTGLKLRSDSVRINGSKTSASVGSDGRTLTFNLGDLPANTDVQIDYVVDVTVSAKLGEAVNTAIAEATSGTQSNQARASMLVQRAFLNDRAFLMGRVIIGECGVRDNPGKAGVRLYMEDGSSVITDDQGRWHFEGITPGTHVLQVDTSTLGSRYTLQQCQNTSRKAGNPASRFIELQGGSLWREEFYLSEKPLVSAHIQQQLFSVVGNGTVEVRLPLSNGETEFEQVDIQVFLPDTLTPVPGSVRLDGQPVSDPQRGENFYQLSMTPSGRYWQHQLVMTLAVDPDARDKARQTIQVRSRGTTTTGEMHYVTSMNELDLTPAKVQEATLRLNPQFTRLSAELSELDILSIQQTALFLKNFNNVELDVVGHTDATPIRRGASELYRNNDELSLARAEAVATALRQYISLPDNAIRVSGAGARQPIANNNTDSGRAQNRRVDIRIRTFDRIEAASVALVNGDSGLSQAGARQQRLNSDAEPGIKNLKDGMKLSLPVISVSGTLDNRLTPQLRLNGEVIPARKLAMKIDDAEHKVTHYTWLGIELPETGDYTLQLAGLGPFGNVRYQQDIQLTRTSDIKAIELDEILDNVADGQTPVRVKLALIDQSGRRIASRTDLRLLSGALIPAGSGARNDDLNRARGIVEVDADGIASFEPVATAGSYRIRLGNDQVQSDAIEIPVAPKLRDWILVGFAKGSVGYNQLNDNSEALPDAEQHGYSDGEAALFARGRVRGDWLLTMAYDSRRQQGDNPLGGQINPEQWYVLYGDSAQRQNEAASQEKLYLRIERQDFYALFGDYDTGLTVTELSRYQRTLTGFKSEYRGRHLSSTVFAANTSQAFLREDIRGDGTSGLYRIGSGDILPGSEVIRIETRDRFNNSVLSSETRTRFIDYSLDYSDGTLYFRAPVPVQDSQFNPVYIVIEYERDNHIENLSGGGRVAVHSAGKQLELGVTAIHEGTEGQRGDLQGLDLNWRPDAHHRINAEFAQTERQQLGSTDLSDAAWLIEHQFQSEKLDTRIRAEQQQAEFGLGQQASSESGVEQLSAMARYRITETYTVSTEARRQQLLDQDQQRDSLDTRLEYDRNDWTLYGGMRNARDDINGEQFQSDLLTAGASKKLLARRLTLSANGEADIADGANNNDYPNKLGLDADYRINRIASVFANQEFAWGDEYSAQETRAGVRATPWQGGTLTTDIGQSSDEYGPRVFTHAGLYQTLQLSSQWYSDFGIDRAQTLQQGKRNPGFDDGRRSPASGTSNDDYTAFAVGLGYRDADWQWTSRVENRLSDASDKWNLFSGFHHRLDGANTLIGRASHRDEKIVGGSNSWESQFDLSLSHRPADASWWLLNRSSLILDGVNDSFGALHGKRVVNNFTSNFNPVESHQLALMYGARYVLESINGDNYQGYSDLLSAEYRYNLTDHWDIGARGSLLKSWQADNSDRSYGVMVGVSPVRDVWISLGYNFRGFYDGDFDSANSRVGGVVLDFRIKFDQNSFRRETSPSPVMR